MTGVRPKIERQGQAAEVLAMIAEGQSLDVIAEETGASRSSVSDYRQKNAELIEELRKDMMQHDVPRAVAARTMLVDRYTEEQSRARRGIAPHAQADGEDVHVPMDKTDKQHAHAHILKLHEVAGLYPSRSNNLNIQVNDHSQHLNIEKMTDDELFRHVMDRLGK